MPKDLNQAINEQALIINQLIKDSHEYQEYLAFKNALAKELILEEDELIALQKQIVNDTYNEAKNLEGLKAEYLSKRKKFLSNDFVKAYQNAYENYANLIEQIKDRLENIL